MYSSQVRYGLCQGVCYKAIIVVLAHTSSFINKEAIKIYILSTASRCEYVIYAEKSEHRSTLKTLLKLKYLV